MTLSGRIRPRASVMAEQGNKNSDCQLPFPGCWWVLQPDRGNEETRSVDVALLKEPQRFARCDTQSSEAQDPKSHSRSLVCWTQPGTGSARRQDRRRIDNDSVKCPPFNAACGFGLAGVGVGGGFHSFIEPAVTVPPWGSEATGKCKTRSLPSWESSRQRGQTQRQV